MDSKLKPRATTLSVGALTLVAACSCLTAAAKPKTPNVVFIYADDLGKGMLSCNGQKHLTTPNIDRIVEQGVKYDNAYSSAYSAPARASLLTGYNDCRNDKYKQTYGGPYCVADTTLIAAAEKKINDADLTYAKDDLTLAKVFKAAGYKTAAVGKLEWGFLSTRKQMAARGWDHYYGYLDHQRCHGFYPSFLFTDGRMELIEGNTDPNAGVTLNGDSPEATAARWNMEGKKVYCEDLFVDHIVNYIEENKDEQFFLYYPSILPHGPVSIPAIHPELLANHELTQIEKEYASMVKKLDDNVGAILDKLESAGILENTIVIFSADNGHRVYYDSEGRTSNDINLITGEAFDDYKNKFNSVTGGDRFNGNGSTSGYKRSNLDGGVNVPWAFYWKGHLEPRVSDQLIANYDLLPTMADMLGVKLKVAKSGSSYLSELMDQKPLKKDKYVITDSQVGGPMIVNNEEWKLRYYFKAKCFELFNTKEDPMEQNNVIDANPEIAAKLQAQLEAECAKGYGQTRFYVNNKEALDAMQAAFAARRAAMAKAKAAAKKK
ncbi:MAG: sulfatase-like hydrolase/transferase [Rikenellaceae bacterium]